MKKITLLFILIFGLNSYCQTAGNGVTDIDSNTYNSVIIGIQEWQKENLNVSKYSDGTIIPQVTDATTWVALTTGAWCYFQNSTANGIIYGKLYNWYAAIGIYDTASLTNPALRKKLAPIGWHVPTDEEWTTLTTFLGGESIAGAKMKETGTAHWLSPNTSATNSSGFTGLPGGCRTGYGTFNSIGQAGYWWSSLDYDAAVANGRIIDANFNELGNSGFYKKLGFSMRCVKDVILNNQNFNNKFFKIYPNPTHSLINIQTSNSVVLDKITITDLMGKTVMEQIQNTNQVSVEKLATGVYILNGYSEGNKFQEKFIKE